MCAPEIATWICSEGVDYCWDVCLQNIAPYSKSFLNSSSVISSCFKISYKSQPPISLLPCMGMVVARPSGCFHLAWLPFCLTTRNPSFLAAFCRSLALAGMSSQRINIRGKHAPFFFVLIPYHLEDVCQLHLSLLGGLAPGMAARNCRYIGHECTIVFGAKDYSVVIKAFHWSSISPFSDINLRKRAL